MGFTQNQECLLTSRLNIVSNGFLRLWKTPLELLKLINYTYEDGPWKVIFAATDFCISGMSQTNSNKSRGNLLLGKDIIVPI